MYELIATPSESGALVGGADPVLVLSLRQAGSSRGAVLVRTTVEPAALAPAVRRTVAGLDPAPAIIGPRTLEEATRLPYSSVEIGATGTVFCGLLALLLAIAGLYGVVSYSVTRRVREIGIRVALGARAGGVASMVVRRSVSLVLTGLGIGMLLSFALSGILRRLIHGVSPTDPLTFGAVGAIILAVGAVASWLPARHAAHVDPMEVLRAE